MKRKIIKAFLLLSFLTLTSAHTYSQESTKISPYIQLQYFKDNNNERYLKTTLTYSKNRMELPLPGMKVVFSAGTEKKVSLTGTLTDARGIAVYYLKHDTDFLTDRNGRWPFNAFFAGNDSIEPASADVSIQEVILTMELKEADSVKTVVLKAEKNDMGKMVPVSGENVEVYVPRMFSLLPIGEVALDDNGAGSVEFPVDLPGDKEGNITIISRFEENPDFGNVEKRSTLKWGVPAIASAHSSHRALWTKTAPKWMIYTLTTLLAGVWGHYLFAIISLIRIRINAKRIKEQEDYGK